MTQPSILTRRTVLKGAAAGATAAGAAVASKRSSLIHAPAVIAKQGSTTDIVYWGSWSGDLGKAEQEVVKRFNESQQDVRVEYQFQGTYEETAQKLTAALAAKQTPDVSALSDVWWFKFYLNQTLAGLDDLFAAEGVDKADYVDSLLNEGVRDGVTYWVPFARSTPLFYYNKEAFAEIGLDGPPKTWSEFAEVAPGLVKKDGDTVTRSAYVHAASGSYIAWLFQGVTWAFGGDYSDEAFDIKIDEPGAVAAGEFFRKSVQDGWATITQDPDNGPNSDFINGTAASMMASTGGLAGVKAAAQFDFGTSFLLEEKAFGCCTGGAGLAVLAASEKREAAFKYVAFASSPEVQTFWSQATGYMPVRKSAAASEEMQSFFALNPSFKVAVDQLAKTRPQDAARVFIPNGDQIIGGGLEQILINGQDAQSAFDDVAETLTEEARPIIEALDALK